MVADDTIDEFAGGDCGPVGGGAYFRTKNEVASTPENKLIQTKFKLKLDDAGGGFSGFIATGQWYDDDDGVAEDPSTSGDTYECSGVSSTVVGSKGFEFAGP
jgi:hypothetical protein